MQTRYTVWSLTLCGLVIAFFSGWFLEAKTSGDDTTGHPIREQAKYKYINPLLAYEISERKEFKEFNPIKDELNSLINTEIRSNRASQVSVYFRDLANGRWFGINENEKYNPASLLKVATMIGVYKVAETNPDILSKRITYDGSFDDNKAENIKPLKTVEPGKTYTIEDLMQAMIGYSDNNAKTLIHQAVDNAFIADVYSDLGLPLPENAPNDLTVDFMSVKSYSLLFRVLYNSTYLSREYSEKALELLGLPDFPEGISAGIPAGVAVASKFGERSIRSADGKLLTAELHDCGIIYYPNHPYILCIMTKGADFSDLTNLISDASRSVYTSFDRLVSAEGL